MTKINDSILSIELSQGLHTKVNKSDYAMVSKYKWFARKTPYTYYASTNIYSADGKRKTLQLHRFITNAKKGLEVDHKDRNGLNNTRNNLRVCKKADNQHNCSKRTDNTSGYKGVSWIKCANAWGVRISNYGERIYLGIFKDKESAILARNSKILELHGEYSRF